MVLTGVVFSGNNFHCALQSPNKSGTKNLLLAVVILSSIGLAVKNFAFLPMGLDIVLTSQIFLFAGLMIRRYNVLERLNLLLCGVLILIVTVVFFFNEPIDIAMRIYGNLLWYYAGGRR